MYSLLVCFYYYLARLLQQVGELYGAGLWAHTHKQITPVQTEKQNALVSTVLVANYLELWGNDILSTSQGTVSHMPLQFIINSKFSHRNGSEEEHRTWNLANEGWAAGGMTVCEKRCLAFTSSLNSLLGCFFSLQYCFTNSKQGPSWNKI